MKANLAEKGGGTVAVLFFVLALVLAGCSSVQDVRRAPGFALDDLAAGGLAIGAITRRDLADYYAQEPLAEAIRQQFAADLPEVKVIPYAEFKSALGTNRLAALRNAFFELGELAASDIGGMALLEGSARYALFVDISRDETADHDATAERPVMTRVWDPDRQRYMNVWTESQYTRLSGSSRSIAARFVIFDIRGRREVWSGSTSADDAYFNTGSATDRIPNVKPSGGPAQADLFQGIASRMAKKLRQLR